MKNINWEKLGVYFVCIGTLYMFWSSQNDVKDQISDIRERIRALEVKVEHLEARCTTP